MDWTRTRFDIAPKDRSTFRFDFQPSRVLLILHADKVRREGHPFRAIIMVLYFLLLTEAPEKHPESWVLKSMDEWNEWLSKVQLSPLLYSLQADTW